MSGSVAAGAIFTLPALYILDVAPHPWQAAFICVTGGCLGVLFLIPLRRYFVRDTHGELPFPEATAITEVLVTGEKGGSQAALLLQATGIAALYDFIGTTFQIWKTEINFQFMGFMKTAADKGRMVLALENEAFILGLGYVMGLRSSMILCAGGLLSNLVLVPIIWMIGSSRPDIVVLPGKIPIQQMAADAIAKGYVRYVGVGAIATAGIFGIIKSLKVIYGSFSIAAKAFRSGEAGDHPRTDVDMSIVSILVGAILCSLAAAILFWQLSFGFKSLLVGLLLMLVFSFFFTSVAANAIATTARNPISGMTMLTIIISSVVLLNFGISGTSGMFFVMAIAGMVCTALSVSGQTITDLKSGYWLGATPAVQERVRFWGVIVSAVAAALTIVLLHQKFFFGDAPPGTDPSRILASPQASIMAALVKTFVGKEPVAWILLGAGAVIAVVLEMVKVPALTFALGMYLPLYLNTPALVGGFLAYLIDRRADRTGGVRGRTIRERGIIIASGLMAGGAFGSVIGAGLQIGSGIPKESWIGRHFGWLVGFFENFSEESLNNIHFRFWNLFGWGPTPEQAKLAASDDAMKGAVEHFHGNLQILSLALFIGLCLYIWFDSIKKPKGAAE